MISSRPQRAACWSAVWLATQLSGCLAERDVAATQIVVTVDSDLDPSQLRAIDVEISDPSDARVVGRLSYELAQSDPERGAVRLPFSFAIDRGRRDEVRVTARALGDPAAGSVGRVPLVEHKVDARFVAHQTLLLRVFLSRDCLGELCDARSSCRPPSASAEFARCAAIEFEPLSGFVATRENEWPPREDTVDSRSDAGPDIVDVITDTMDAGTDRADVSTDLADSSTDTTDAVADQPEASRPEVGSANLILNPSFEDRGNGGTPVHWRRDAWLASPTYCPASVTPETDEQARACWMRQADGIASEGTHSAFIEIPQSALNDARWVQRVAGLTPGHSYELCGKIRGTVGPTAPGANLFYDTMVDSPVSFWSQTGAFPDWPEQPHCATFQAFDEDVEVGCRIGFYSATTYGFIWCDEMSLREVESPVAP